MGKQGVAKLIQCSEVTGTTSSKSITPNNQHSLEALNKIKIMLDSSPGPFIMFLLALSQKEKNSLKSIAPFFNSIMKT